MKDRSNKMIEAFRFVCCIVVLCIHCAIPKPIGVYFNKYGRFAVPFFLIVSGYYSGENNFASKSFKKLKQTLTIIFLNAPICIVWNCINSYIKTGSFSNWANYYFSLTTLKELILFNRAVFINSSFYYFFVLLYVYTFCLIVSKLPHKAMKFVYIMAFSLLVIGYYIHHFTNHEWYHVGNFLFTGIPLFFLGRFLHLRPSITHIVNGFELPILCLCLLVTYLEVRFFHRTYINIGQVSFAVTLLCLCLNNSNKKINLLSYLGTGVSMFIMIYHCQVRDTVKLFINSATWYFPIVVILTTTSLGIINMKIKQRYPLH